MTRKKLNVKMVTHSKERILSSTVKDSTLVESASTNEWPYGKDFRGSWLTEGGNAAKVTNYFGGFWFGQIHVCDFWLPTFWDTNGDSSSVIFNLKKRKRDAEGL